MTYPRTAPQTKEEAIAIFRELIARYGLKWTAAQPATAYKLLAACNKFLTPEDRRAALGMGRKS